jgi:hypothetical protein
MQDTIRLGIRFRVEVRHVIASLEITFFSVLEVIQDELSWLTWGLQDVLSSWDLSLTSLILGSILLGLGLLLSCRDSSSIRLINFLVSAGISRLALIINDILGLDIHVGWAAFFSRSVCGSLAIWHMKLMILTSRRLISVLFYFIGIIVSWGR